MPVCIPKEFKNPDKKSLKDLYIVIRGDDGVTRKVPALDKYWATRSNFTTYISLVVAGGRIKHGVALEEWEYEADNFKNDMEFLLGLPHYEFWSYLVYQKNALASMRSFLQNATPFYLNILPSIPHEIQEIYEHLVNVVVRVICRMLTPKESPESWMDKDQLRELLYEKYLLTFPMLLDLLMVIGVAEPDNCEILKKIFDTLFKIVPNYKKDLEITLAFFKTAFRSIHTQTENEGCEGAGGGLPDDDFETPFDDVALYALDCASTLSALLQACPLTRSLCLEIGLPQAIANLYDTTLPNLYRNISQINDEALSLNWLQQARIDFLWAFRYITYSCVEAVLLNPEASLLPSENFIAILTECLSEQAFVIDYERFYPVSLDMDIIKQGCKEIDGFKMNFLIEGYERAAEPKITKPLAQINDNVPTEHCNNDSDQPAITIKEEFLSSVDKSVEKSCDIDIKVGVVLDCLPHLGTGFIRRLLTRYDSSEEAITAILENNLPPDLEQADQTEAYIPEDVQDQLLNNTGIKHFNVFDGDKYDIMTQENPQCVVKRGKGCPLAPKNAIELLDDKCDLAAIRHRYQEYTLVQEDDDSDEYKDEYDDSYDALLESETRVKKSTQFKQVLDEVGDDSEDDSDSEANDNELGGGEGDDRNVKTLNFCENPEVIRARWEAKYQNKFKAGGGKKIPSNNNVVGGPKGQGQAKDVLRNRQKKEANKSSRANHNRKMGAAFKRSKGMIS